MKAAAQTMQMVKKVGRSLSANETCPECGVSFMIRATIEPGRTPFKVCPNGHETAVYKLAQARKAATPKPVDIPPLDIDVKPTSKPVATVTPKFGNGTGPATQRRASNSVLRRARDAGIAGDVESLQLGLAAAIGVYDQILATAPPQFKPLVLGAGGRSIDLAREILEAV